MALSKRVLCHGMQDGGQANNEGPRIAALVGNPMYDLTRGCRWVETKHAFFIPFLGAAAMQGARMFAALRAIAAGAKAFSRGFMTGAPELTQSFCFWYLLSMEKDFKIYLLPTGRCV